MVLLGVVLFGDPFRAMAKDRQLLANFICLVLLIINGLLLQFLFIDKCLDCGGCLDDDGRSAYNLTAGCYYEGQPERIMGIVFTVLLLLIIAAKFVG